MKHDTMKHISTSGAAWKLKDKTESGLFIVAEMHNVNTEEERVLR